VPNVVPMKRPGQPAELATAFVMLADPLSSYVSGATIAVTGGKPILGKRHANASRTSQRHLGRNGRFPAGKSAASRFRWAQAILSNPNGKIFHRAWKRAEAAPNYSSRKKAWKQEAG
jgi:hypothetical protein